MIEQCVQKNSLAARREKAKMVYPHRVAFDASASSRLDLVRRIATLLEHRLNVVLLLAAHVQDALLDCLRSVDRCVDI